MDGDGLKGVRDLIFSLAGWVAVCGAARAQSPGSATLQALPLATSPSGSVSPAVDPFAASVAPVQTPFVPYASQAAEREAVELGASRKVVATPPNFGATLSPPAMSRPIDPGNMVPVNLPNAVPTQTVVSPPPVGSPMPQAMLKSPSVGPSQSESFDVDVMTPIKPAVRTRTSNSPLTKTSKAKGVEIDDAPRVEATPVVEQPEAVRAPIRFSFPQPIIPLESSLRRWLGLTPSRR